MEETVVTLSALNGMVATFTVINDDPGKHRTETYENSEKDN